MQWYSGLSHLSGYKCFEFWGKILLIYPVPSNDNKKDYELSVTDFDQLPPDPFAILAHGKNTGKNYHQTVFVTSSAKPYFKKNWPKRINQLLPPEAGGKKSIAC